MNQAESIGMTRRHFTVAGVSVGATLLAPSTMPEMRAAWKEGRKELFYPYGKTYAQTLGEQD
jgi:hypothetical protein